ncbi:MAG: MBL fold metallo-hydrolase [Acidobacteriota bacterium]
MKPHATTVLAGAFAFALFSGRPTAQSTARPAARSAANDVDAHVAAAKAAAGQDHVGLFDAACAATSIRPGPGPQPGTLPGKAPGQREGPAPDRSRWYVEPAKVFDNLYFVGEKEFSSWAVVASDGIIVIDAIYDYSVEEEVVGGLKKLGLDPTKIKYLIVSHAHADHYAGARFLQDRLHPRVILSAADWDFLERTETEDKRPKRDMIATDGMKLTLGDTTLTLYLTPGHTAGTISTLIPVKDGGRPHLAALWGGTMFNFPRSRAAFDTYIASAERFQGVLARAGADTVISNHTPYDGSKTKIPALATRKPGEQHPYVIGGDAVKRYLTVAKECATAAQAALPR